MAAIPLPKITSLKEINKWPLAFALVVSLWLVREFMADNKAKTKENSETYKQQADRLEKENNKKDTTIAYWQSKYIQEVEKNASYFKRQDSANRAALEKPAKDILKIVKHQNNEKVL